MSDERSLLSRLRASAAETAPGVVVVQPGDSLQTVLDAVQATGAANVQLLVSEGTTALQSVRSLMALQAFLSNRVMLTVLSADAKVVQAATQAGLVVLNITDTPPPPRPRVTPVVPTPPAPPRPAITQPDAEFLAGLEQERPPAEPVSPSRREQYTGLSDADADFYSGLDDLSDAIQAASTQPAERVPRANRDAYVPGDDPADAPPRSSDRTVAGGRSGTGRTAEPAAKPRRDAPTDRPGGRTSPTTGVTRPRPTRPRREPAPQPPQRVPYLTLALIGLGVLALLAFGWILTGTVTVLVSPPNTAARELPIENAVIPYAPARDIAGAALVAQPVTAEASFTFEGRVDAEVVTPAERARGVVQITNMIEQAIELPAGTDFIGANERGEEVRFTIDQPVLVPGAVTTATPTGRSTTYGVADVSVVARSPGSASNVGANAIKQILIPGQQPIVTDRGNFIFRHEPIGGGSEAPQRVVTDAAVQQVLGEALTGLYGAGLEQLRAQVDEGQSSIDPTTIAPDPVALGSPESYDPPVVEPPVGSTLSPENPVFRVTVKARFTGLAVPRDQLISKQLETTIPAYYNQNPICTANEAPGYNITGWRWDGGKLTVSGSVVCSLRAILTPEALEQVRAAVIGQTRDAAESRLRELQRAGVIGNYALPDRPQMPGLEFMIRVQPQQGALQRP